jgi:hypothetical protein
MTVLFKNLLKPDSFKKAIGFTLIQLKFDLLRSKISELSATDSLRDLYALYVIWFVKDLPSLFV